MPPSKTHLLQTENILGMVQSADSCILLYVAAKPQGFRAHLVLVHIDLGTRTWSQRIIFQKLILILIELAWKLNEEREIKLSHC